jgi:hypothetical protein
MVLAEAEDVEPDLVGQRDLFDEVAQPFMRADRARPGYWADVGEGIETEFHAVPRTFRPPTGKARHRLPPVARMVNGVCQVSRRPAFPGGNISQFRGGKADLALELSTPARM